LSQMRFIVPNESSMPHSCVNDQNNANEKKPVEPISVGFLPFHLHECVEDKRANNMPRPGLVARSFYSASRRSDASSPSLDQSDARKILYERPPEHGRLACPRDSRQAGSHSAVAAETAGFFGTKKQTAGPVSKPGRCESVPPCALESLLQLDIIEPAFDRGKRFVVTVLESAG